MGELENYFAKKMPTMEITFYESTGDSVSEGINNFMQHHKVDLLVMYAPQRNIFERLFHQSQTKRMVYLTEVPLFVYKEQS
jgi:nucleotide-binding universal stress UspA family protein